MEAQTLEEGWVKFDRYPCVKGYLDHWRGDCINDPNSPAKSLLNLNMTASYWRCNGSIWVNERDFRVRVHELISMRGVFEAQEIWDELIEKP